MSEIRIEGDVARPRTLSFAELAALPAESQIDDVSRFDPKRTGGAVTLRALAALVEPAAEARFLGLHASADDFHAFIPLAPILDRAILMYRTAENEPLPKKAGGPFRFFIPDHHACKTHEIDECANVKFVDRMEFTREAGFDNRPHDEREHADLHAKEQ